MTSANAASLISARVDLKNQPGNGMLARDGSWSVPLLSLPGRADLDLGLGLSYSSMVWTEFRCVEVKDRNGNYITVNHYALGRITTVIDTLSRVITFNYDSNANLISITQAWNGQPSHQWVGFSWGMRNMQASFSGGAVIGPQNGTSLPVITQVTLPDSDSRIVSPCR